LGLYFWDCNLLKFYYKFILVKNLNISIDPNICIGIWIVLHTSYNLQAETINNWIWSCVRANNNGDDNNC
jgi:hypothetical protein